MVWGAIAAAGLAAEAYGLFGGHEGDTLSEVTRAVFHTDHVAGKAAFTVGWLALTAWFVPHIVAPAWQRAAEVIDSDS
jgi:hypothetical protein